MKAVILAGGKGTRLAPYTTVLPKPLMPVGDMPILEVVVKQLAHHGITDLTFAVGHLAELIEAFFGNGEKFGVRIDYSIEDEPLGTAGPLGLVKGLDERFLVMNGDLLTTIDYTDLVRFHEKRASSATLAVFKKRVDVNLGVLTIDDDARVRDYTEKPTLSYDVSTGIYVFEPEILALLEPGEPMDLPDLVKRLIAAGRAVHAYAFDGLWLDIGRHEDYELAIERFQSSRGAFLPWERDN